LTAQKHTFKTFLYKLEFKNLKVCKTCLHNVLLSLLL